MSSQSVVTELVIDADTSGADKFSQSMDSAALSAANTTLAVAGVGVAFVASLAALRGFVDYVGGVNKQLVDIAENARNAGMSTLEFQQELFAAKSSGLSDKDFVSGLDKIQADLTAASRGVTEFGKLYEQNGLSIRQANGDIKTSGMAVVDLMGLMQNATPAIQRGVASIAGISKDWIPFLRQATEEMEAQKKAAADLGVTINDDVIQKSKEFDTQWKTAIATWDLQFKASLASIMPMLVQMATLASKIIEGVGSVSSSVSRWTTPDEDKSKSQLNDQINDAARLVDLMDRLGNQDLRVTNLKELLGLPGDASLDKVFALIDKLSALYDKKPTQVAITGGTTVLPPSGSDANDPVDRAINSLQKHIQTQIADTQAIGLGDAALAGFKVEAAETAAVLANGGKETDAQIDKFSDLKDAAIAAADALAKAKVASSIEFNTKTAFLSSADVAIANQLKGIYGNDVPAALNSTYAAAIRVNNAFKEVSSAIETNLTSGLTDIAMGTVSVSQGFSNMGLAVVKAVEQMIIKIAIVQPMMQALQNSIGGGGLFGLLSGSNGNAGGAILPFSTGNVPIGDYSMPTFADGTDSAPGGLSIVGERGPEIVNLPKGSQVFPNGKMPGNDNGPQNVFTYAPNIDARGADAAAVARLATVIAQDRQNFERNVQGVMAKTSQNNPGFR